jgi:hypothetical protein
MMKLILAAILASAASFAQGTLIFYNRGLTGPNGTTYNAPMQQVTDPATAKAQLFLITGSGGSATYTPVPGVNTFRPVPNQAFMVAPITVAVPGQPAGTTGLHFVLRVWERGPSYGTSPWFGQSAEFTAGPLGGVTPDGQIFLPPDLGGPGGVGGLQSFVLVPERSTIALGLLSTAALLISRRKRTGLP